MDFVLILPISVIAFLLAGMIKGVAGIGLPSVAIALMAMVIDPRISISLVMFPMLFTNFWQAIRGNDLRKIAKKYWLFAAILFASVAATTRLTKDVPDRGLLFVLGIVLLLFVVASWRKNFPQIIPKHDRKAQAGFGVFTGVVGGMTAGWGAPIAMYLATKSTPKDEFVQASGFLITVGSIPLAVGYAMIGHLNGKLALMSAFMILPALLGFSFGERLRHRLSAQAFRKVLLVLFAFLAVNLLRKAIWYVPLTV